jgi:hypothetical protein
MLLPAPVELPCRDNRTKGMCSRALAIADLKKRFAEDPATADLLHLLCGPLTTGPVQSCTRPIREEVHDPRSLRAHAPARPGDHGRRQQGHAAGPARARHPGLELRRPGQHPARDPLDVGPGDEITVTCTHDQELRDLLPAFEGTEDRYVAWGEGTTDEMCLGIVLMTER